MSEHTTNEIPYGYCHCGCGAKTKIAPRNRKEAGWVKGEPLRYIHRHAQTGTAPKVNPNPSGLCMCGCGEPAPIAKRTNTKLGHIQGQPVRFIIGHHVRLHPTRPVADRFWEKIDKRGPDDCWDWQGCQDKHGYGFIWNGERAERAYRVSYEIHHGAIPDGLSVLHRCDRPSCCNPAHLFTGTARDNVNDMIEKGRENYVQGEDVGNAMLTNAQVREFRLQFSEMNMSVTAFAAFHDVPYIVMWNLLQRRTYKNA